MGAGQGKRGKRITKNRQEEEAKRHPETSVRQVTFKFAERVSKTLPERVPPPEKRFGRAVSFFLRPRFYHFLLAEERLKNWEKYAKAEDMVWKESATRWPKARPTKIVSSKS